MFVEPAYRESIEYKQFWRELNEAVPDGGIQTAGQGRQGGLDPGKLQPHPRLNGKPFKVVKFATNVTGRKRSEDAISLVQAIIEFSLDGIVLTANENFLKTMGYTLEEVKGRHHSLFVDPAYRETAEYRQFWHDLNDGKSRRRITSASPKAAASLAPGDLQSHLRCRRQALQSGEKRLGYHGARRKPRRP